MAVPGSYTINYKATDPSGNVGISPDRTVTVSDTQGPAVSLTAPVNQGVECTKNGSYTDPGYSAVDLCQGALSQSSVTVTGTVNVEVPGPYSLSYQAADSVGNTSAIVTRSVTVADTLAPTITRIGSDVTKECGYSYMDQGAVATDQCDGTITNKIVRTGTVNTAVIGDYTLRYNVKDAATHPATEVTRTVSVRDRLAPTVTLNNPTAQTVECGAAYSDPGATATDQCAGPLTAVVNTSTINMAVPGSYTINYKATDPSGNIGTSSNRTVTVGDTLAPTITLTGSSPLNQECAATFSDPGATATDQCYRNLTGSIVKTGTVDTAVLGPYTIHYNVKDPANNAAPEVTRTVNVRDTLPPIITMNGPPTQSIECGSAYTDPGATAMDACAGPVTAVATSSANPGAPGSYVVTYTATDPSGNKATLYAARTVTVNDTLPPTLTLKGPATQSLECGSPYTDPWATANDACFGDLTSSITAHGLREHRRSGQLHAHLQRLGPGGPQRSARVPHGERGGHAAAHAHHQRLAQPAARVRHGLHGCRRHGHRPLLRDAARHHHGLGDLRHDGQLHADLLRERPDRPQRLRQPRGGGARHPASADPGDARCLRAAVQRRAVRGSGRHGHGSLRGPADLEHRHHQQPRPDPGGPLHRHVHRVGRRGPHRRRHPPAHGAGHADPPERLQPLPARGLQRRP